LAGPCPRPAGWAKFSRHAGGGMLQQPCPGPPSWKNNGKRRPAHHQPGPRPDGWEKGPRSRGRKGGGWGRGRALAGPLLRLGVTGEIGPPQPAPFPDKAEKRAPGPLLPRPQNIPFLATINTAFPPKTTGQRPRPGGPPPEGPRGRPAPSRFLGQTGPGPEFGPGGPAQGLRPGPPAGSGFLGPSAGIRGTLDLRVPISWIARRGRG